MRSHDDHEQASRRARLFCALTLIATLAGCGGSSTPAVSGDAETSSEASSDAGADVSTTTETSIDAPIDASDASPETSTDAGTEVAADGGGACSALALPAAVSIPTLAGPEPLTSLLGGAVTDGLYVLTAATDYTSPSGGTVGATSTSSRAMRISAGHYEVVRSDDGGPTTTESGTLAIAPPVISWGQTMTCPSAGTLQHTRYKSDGTTIVLAVGAPSGADRLLTLTLHP